MTARVTDRFRIIDAIKYVASYSTDQYYLTIGKQIPWADDTNPSPAEDNVDWRDNQYWADMIGAKRIESTDVTHAIQRYDWLSGSVYAMYRSGYSSLYSSQFYVVSPAQSPQPAGSYNVFKCIDNNGGAASTVDPSSQAVTTTGTFTTTDGYVWKFMYQISAADVAKFMNTQFIPVKAVPSDNSTLQGQVQQSAVDGAILSVYVANGGSGYTAGSPITFTGDGDGTLAGTIDSVSSPAGTILKISISNPGTKYTYATATAPGGTGAVLLPNIAPYGGHGSNAIFELGGYYILHSVDLIADENTSLTVQNDYRTVGILKDPSTYNTLGTSSVSSNSVLATDLNVRETFKFPLKNTPAVPFVNDEVVIQATTNARGTVVEYDSTNKILYLNNVIRSNQYHYNQAIPASDPGYVAMFHLDGTENVTGQTSGAIGVLGPEVTTGTTLNKTVPGLEHRTGEFLYLENRRPIERVSDQTERVRIIVQF